MIELFLALLILIVAVGTGILSATVGVGGGFIMVSFMIAYMGLKTQTAVGTSAFVIIFSALSASVAYFRQKRIDYRIGTTAACFSIPGALIGGYTTSFIPSSGLALLFALALVIVGMKMILFPRERAKGLELRDEKGNLPNSHTKKKSSSPRGKSFLRWKTEIIDAASHKFAYRSNVLPALPFFFLAGFLSGLFGIGGGIVIVPTLQIIAGLPLHLAVATSMFTMVFTSASSGLTHVLLGNVMFDYAVFLIVGIIVGAQGGARVAKRLKSSALERVFGVTMLLISIYLIVTEALAP
nr:sulfite exporter TauE/SafE family protein [Candidatus Njordarchaeota archaeon]